MSTSTTDCNPVSCQFCSNSCIEDEFQKEQKFHAEIKSYCQKNKIDCNPSDCHACKYNYYCGQ